MSHTRALNRYVGNLLIFLAIAGCTLGIAASLFSEIVWLLPASLVWLVLVGFAALHIRVVRDDGPTIYSY